MATSTEVKAMGFVLPGGTDLISNGDDAIQLNAFAAAEGILAARFGRPDPGPFDFDAMKTPGTYALGGLFPEGWTNVPEGITTASVFTVYGTPGKGWCAQELIQYGKDPKRLWRVSESTVVWGPWEDISTADQAMAANEVRKTEMLAATGGAVDTGGTAAFALRLDHGFTNYKTKLRAGLLARGIVPGIATNSRQWDLAENSAATIAEVDAWAAAGEIEILNHGATHGQAMTSIHDEIVNGKAELEAQLPSASIHGFAPPGESTWWGGFNGGRADGWDDPTAGVILSNHAYSFGYVGGAHRVIDGTIRQGLSHITLDTYDLVAARAQIDTAIAEGRGIQMMMHPRILDDADRISTADFFSLMDYVVAKRAAGELVTLSPSELVLADSTRPPVTVPDVAGLAARLAALEYESGPRNINGLIMAGVPSWTRAHRSRTTVDLYLNSLDLTNVPANTTILTLPPGWRPLYTRRLTSSSTSGYPYIDTGGALKYNGTPGTVVISGTWLTSPAVPTSPLGDPA